MTTHVPIIVSNKEWQDLIGIQYALGGSDPKLGLSCYGLVRQVYQGLQITLPEYQQPALDAELAAEAAGNDWTRLDAPQPFAVTLIRSEGNASEFHLAIVTPELTLLHSLPKKGVVVSSIDKYSDRIIGFYRYTPGQGERLPLADGTAGRIIGMIALTAATIYTGGVAGAAYGAFWGAMAATAVSIGGNMILNLVAPIKPEGNALSGYTGDLADSRSYTWDGIQNDARQGLSKAVIFGIIKVGGQIISEKTWLDHNNNDYYDVLLCPAIGRVARLSTVQINDTDIGMYKNSGWDCRYGEDEQTAIDWFEKIYLQYSSSAKIPYDASTTDPASSLQFTTKGDVTGIRMIVSAPAGIYQMVANVPVGYPVTFKVQYKEHSSSTWAALPMIDPAASTDHPYIRRTTGTIPNTANPITLTDTGANFASRLALGSDFEITVGATTYYCTQITSDLTADTVTFNSFADAGHTTAAPFWMTATDYVITNNSTRRYTGQAPWFWYWESIGGELMNPAIAFETEVSVKAISFRVAAGPFAPGSRLGFQVLYQLTSASPTDTSLSAWHRALQNNRPALRPYQFNPATNEYDIASTTYGYFDFSVAGLTPGTYRVAIMAISFDEALEYNSFTLDNLSLDTSSVDGVFTLNEDSKIASHATSTQIELTSMTEATYDFRIWRTTEDQTAADYQDDVYLRSYAEIIEKRLAYPNHTLLGIRAMGTDRLSGGRPKITSVATGVPLTLPTTHYHTTVAADDGMVDTYATVVGWLVTGKRKIKINTALTTPIDPAFYWLVWDDSPGMCQSDRLLTKHYQRVSVWDYSSGGQTYIYLDGSEAVPVGTAVTLFKEDIDPYVSRHTAWATAKMLIEGSHGRITENNIDWPAFVEWDVWNMETGKNKFNIDDADISLAHYVQFSDGVLISHATYNATGYIPVIGNATYTLSYKHQIAWYDSNKIYISGSNSSDTNKTQTAPINAKFLRCTVNLANWASFQAEIGPTQTAFEAYNPAKVEPRHLYDAVIDFNTDLWSLAMKAAQTARGNVFKKGNKYSVWVDKAASHVQLFGEGNSTNVSVNPIPRSDRANILTTSFLDEASNYDQKDISRDDVQVGEYPIVKNIPVQVGVVRESQVTGLLDFMLLQNRYVGTALSLDAGIDSIEVMVGKVFMQASQAKDFALSGRVVNVNTSTVDLDQPFTPEAGTTYQLTVWAADGTLYTWSGTVTGTDITSITKPTGLPVSDHYEYPYVLCKATEERMKYRCIGIRRTADTMHATLTGIEYRDEIYAND